jgi:uncharacterized protein involved in copper resistance
VRRVDVGEVEELVMAESCQGRSKLGTHQHCTSNSIQWQARLPESVRVRQQWHATKRSLGRMPQEAACIGQAVSDGHSHQCHECSRRWAQRHHVHDDVCAKPRSSFKYNQFNGTRSDASVWWVQSKGHEHSGHSPMAGLQCVAILAVAQGWQ